MTNKKKFLFREELYTFHECLNTIENDKKAGIAPDLVVYERLLAFCLRIKLLTNNVDCWVGFSPSYLKLLGWNKKNEGAEK